MMQIKISGSQADVSMATMERNVLYLVKHSRGIDNTYSEGSIIYRDDLGKMILFNPADNKITAFASPTLYPGIKLEKYKKPLILEN